MMFTVILTAVLGALTLILGIIAIAAFQEIGFLLYAGITNTKLPALRLAWGNPLTFLLAVALATFTIYSSRYHMRHLGQLASWRLFGWTLGIELLILTANLAVSMTIFG